MSITIRVTFWRVLAFLMTAGVAIGIAEMIGSIGSVRPSYTIDVWMVLEAILRTVPPAFIFFMVGRESRGNG